MLHSREFWLICAAGCVIYVACVGACGLLAAQEWRLARLEWWAEHAIGCWPDGCNFQHPMPKP